MNKSKRERYNDTKKSLEEKSYQKEKEIKENKKKANISGQKAFIAMERKKNHKMMILLMQKCNVAFARFYRLSQWIKSMDWFLKCILKLEIDNVKY